MKEDRKKVRFVATARQMYAGRALRMGDEFDGFEDETDELAASKMAQRVADQPTKGLYKRRDMKAEQ